MKTNTQCVKCIDNAARRTLSILKIKNKEQLQVMAKVKTYLSGVNRNLTPMEVSFGINEIMREETGIYDPFKLIKEESNNNALELVSRVKKIIEESDEPLFDSIRVAIAGNIIDYGMKTGYNLSKTLEEVMKKKPFINDYQLLKEKLSKAKTITFLADNAGEVVFDKLLIDEINRIFEVDKINLIVKKYPFMNDVILEDLENLGFDEIANVEIVALENLTSNNYGNLIEPYLEQADVVIAKGQGNFELLYDKKLEIFFLFIIKCDIVKNILLSEEEEDIVISYH
ncbi:MAG: DUF89 family protein [Candidatus Heimdallarchaeota archaeon]|nr:DUF89 family protein [Candidatus Heimdallarchaeota archaeon]MCK4255007.1 DUF89 family protein [Candidatus Heimdallarchaeota archaeon]